MSFIELVNTDDSSNEQAIVILITNKDSNKTKNSYVTEDNEVNQFELSYSEESYIMLLLDSWYLGGEDIHI